MRDKSKKKKIILLILSIIIILLIALGITYAYFIAVIEPGEKTPIDVVTDTTDNLLFDVEDNINLAINKYNFGVDAGNLTSHAKATATLRANSENNTATYNYYLYFNIESNEFVYTTEDNKPEIILSITGPDGEVKSVEGLTYVAEGSVSGFDITTASGLFTIASNYEITSNSSTEDTLQEWNFTATFINLDSDQNNNTGKSMKGSVVIQKNSAYVTIADICDNSEKLADCIKKYSTSVLAGDTHIIHHNGTILDDAGNVLDANDGSYRYSGGDVKSIVDAHKEEFSTILKSTSSTAETYKPMIGFMCGETESYIGATCNEEPKYYYLIYDEAKTQYEHYNLALEQAVKDGYVERNYVNNFVCFGSTDEVCPNDNLYRIIGVFDNKVKLIKFDYANENLLGADGERGTTNTNTTTAASVIVKAHYKGNNILINRYYWNKNNYEASNTELGFSNIWKNSELNTINLNTNYLNNIGEEWANKIATSKWIVGGNLYANIRTKIPTAYLNEIKNPVTTVPSAYEAKVGLMYASDFGYARKAWTGTLASNYNTNWMFMGIQEWTMTRYANDTNDNFKKSVASIYAYNVTNASNLSVYTASYVNTAKAVRPVFYLNSDVIYASGDGTIENPIRIGE